MKSLQSGIWTGALLLAMCPLGTTAQGSLEPGAAPGAVPQERPAMRRDLDDWRWENRRGHPRMGPHFRRHRRHHRDRGIARMLRDPAVRERVGISADQWTKMQDRQVAFAKSRVRDRADLRLKQVDLRQLLAVEEPDRAAIDKKLQEISEIRLAAQKSAIEYRLATRSALSPEQKEKMKQLLREHRPVERPGSGPAGIQPPAV